MIPSITVAVIAFNSEKTIEETLNSIAAQNFPLEKVELIISDDHSTDGTLDIVRKWAKAHKDLFSEFIVIESSMNHGVSANFNRAAKKATGDWFKVIAADDLLKEDCLSRNIDFIKANPDAKIVFSGMLKFFGSIEDSFDLPFDVGFFARNAKCQNEILKDGCHIYAPTSFIKRASLIDVGYADERFPMLEDYPLWYKLTKNGEKLYAYKEPTVYYRAGDSLSQQSTRIGSISYISSLYSFQRTCIWPDLSKRDFLKKWDDFILYNEKLIGIRFFRNRREAPYKIFRGVLFIFRPHRIYTYLSRFLRKEYV